MKKMYNPTRFLARNNHRLVFLTNSNYSIASLWTVYVYTSLVKKIGFWALFQNSYKYKLECLWLLQLDKTKIYELTRRYEDICRINVHKRGWKKGRFSTNSKFATVRETERNWRKNVVEHNMCYPQNGFQFYSRFSHNWFWKAMGLQGEKRHGRHFIFKRLKMKNWTNCMYTSLDLEIRSIHEKKTCTIGQRRLERSP